MIVESVHSDEWVATSIRSRIVLSKLTVIKPTRLHPSVDGGSSQSKEKKKAGELFSSTFGKTASDGKRAGEDRSPMTSRNF